MIRTHRWCASAIVSIALLLSSPLHAEPLITVEAGAALPLSNSQAALDPGGYIALGAGHRFTLLPRLSVALHGAAGAAIFDNECGATVKLCTDDEAATVLSLTAGPRLILHDGDFEIFFGVRGGYYRSISGGFAGHAGGFGLETGFAYELVPGTSAGMFIRREQASLRPTTKHGDLQFLVVGFGFEHRFAAPLRAVSHPRERPDF